MDDWHQHEHEEAEERHSHQREEAEERREQTMMTMMQMFMTSMIDGGCKQKQGDDDFTDD